MGRLTDIAVLKKEIGSGWAGRVFAAELKAAAYGLPAGGTVAVKLYRPDVFVAARGDMTRRIERELEFGRQGVSDRVVCALDLVEADEGGLPTLALVMEFLEGRTLDKFVADDFPVCDGDLLTIVADLVTAVRDLHEAGLVHRDVRPHNVMVSGARATLTDLGVVKPPADSTSQTTAPSTELLETIPHADGARMFEGLDDEPADAWSLGMTVFHLLYGRPPFQGGRRFPEWAAAVDPDLVDYPEGKDRFGGPLTAVRLYVEANMRSLLTPRDARPLPGDLHIDFDNRARQDLYISHLELLGSKVLSGKKAGGPWPAFIPWALYRLKESLGSDGLERLALCGSFEGVLADEALREQVDVSLYFRRLADREKDAEVKVRLEKLARDFESAR